MFHRAGECDGSGVHEEDLVYVVDGVQAVSDDDRGGAEASSRDARRSDRFDAIYRDILQTYGVDQAR
jgi:hypothetical protein